MCCKYEGFCWGLTVQWPVLRFRGTKYSFSIIVSDCSLSSLDWGKSLERSDRISQFPYKIFKNYYLTWTLLLFLHAALIVSSEDFFLCPCLNLKHCGASSQAFYLISKPYGSICFMISLQNVITVFFWLHMFGIVLSLRDVKGVWAFSKSKHTLISKATILRAQFLFTEELKSC